MTAEKRIRSAKPPTMSAGVIIAKVNWKSAKTLSGMVPEAVPSPICASKISSRPPMKALREPPSPKAKEYLIYSHEIDITQAMVKHCISTLSTFFERTRPLENKDNPARAINSTSAVAVMIQAVSAPLIPSA